MVFNWQHCHTPVFLDAYKKYECLWNKKCDAYTKASDRDIAYKSLTESLKLPGLTVFDVKAKIKTIRTRYMSELGKIINSTPEDTYEPRLSWFKQADQFLRDVSKPQTQTSKLEALLSNKKCSTYNGDCNEVEIIEENECHDEQDAASEECDISIHEVNPDPEDKIPIVMGPTYSLHNRGKKRISQNQSPFAHRSSTKIQRVYDAIEDNEFDMFCSSLAIQLNKMPLHRALICQGKLQAVMTEERLSQISMVSRQENNGHCSIEHDV